MPRKFVPIVLALLAGLASKGRADLTWFNTSTNLMYYADALTPLFGVKGDNTVSCFLQLIYSGSDSLADIADVSQILGTTDDDVAVAWSYVAANLPGTSGSTSHYGRVINLDPVSNVVVGGQYYVRAWTAPSADFLNGGVPLSSTNRYGDSALFSALAGFEPPGAPQNVNFGSADGIIANLLPIPEPRSLLLVLLGLCTVRRWHRRAN